MLSRVQKCLVLVVLVLLVSSCTKLPEWVPAGKGSVAIETLQDKGSIPLKYGSLVSVTSSTDAPNAFQLWYQDEQGNVRMVIYDIPSNSLWHHVRFIPRK
jgi:hypothetical protein